MRENAFKFSIMAALMLGLTFSACKKDETTEQEVVTTVVLQLVATDGSLNQTYEWNDLDGPGGNAPTVDNILLTANKTYTCTISVYDRSSTPEENITDEIIAENTSHLFVYTTDAVTITIAPTDTDDDGKPFRRMTNWTAGSTAIGSVTVTLKHEPDKDAANPDVTGDTDFEVSFPVRIL